MVNFEDCSFSNPVMVSARKNSYLQDKAKIELSLSCNSDGTLTLESKGRQRTKISRIIASKVGFSKFEGTEVSGVLQIATHLKIIFTDNKIVDSGYDLLSIKFNFTGFTPDIDNMKYVLSILKELPTDKSNLPVSRQFTSLDTATATTNSATTRLPLAQDQSIYTFLMERNVHCETLPSCTIMAADDESAGYDEGCEMNALYAELASYEPVRLSGARSSQNEGYLCADPDPDLSNIDFKLIFPKANIVECAQGDDRNSSIRAENDEREQPWLKLARLAENTSFKGAPELVSASGPIYTGLEQELSSQEGATVEDASLSASLPASNIMRVTNPNNQATFRQESIKSTDSNNNGQQVPDRAMVSYFSSGNNLRSLFKH
ncbi:Hypothetical protein GLP15_3073 [Giardia lamblia P15]|uniref:Uncharacterized protein n=1 Tax=Giardia intestinalis (strain P15) TaxID=658858 RepID=E1F950_GIAIA|nr:Hypothetical protein GLP15_3073 [Giardia lamblia P15]